MLMRGGPIPAGTGWSFEVKWDGFRALVSTLDGVRVRSRRGWDMTKKLPELRYLTGGLIAAPIPRVFTFTHHPRVIRSLTRHLCPTYLSSWMGGEGGGAVWRRMKAGFDRAG